MAISGFFSRLGHLAGPQRAENQLSRTFDACFCESMGFRRVVTKLLWELCDLPGKTPAPEQWSCAVERPTPQPGAGRIDIEISCADVSGTRIFHLESKVESELKLEQLLRYQDDGGVKRLIAITKYPPDVPIKELQKHQIRTLRWQDVHQAFLKPQRASQVDHFLFRAFAKYLQETGMAYDEDLTAGELKQLQRVFAGVWRTDTEPVATKRTFDTAERCVRLVRDLEPEIRQSNDWLSNVSKWGPNSWSEADGSVRFHYLGMVLHGSSGWNSYFGWGFFFPESERRQPGWEVWYQRTPDAEPLFKDIRYPG